MDALEPAWHDHGRSTASRACSPATTSPALLIAALERNGIDAARPATSSSSRRRSSPRPRAAISTSPTLEPSDAGPRAGADHRQGRAPGRGRPVRSGRGAARQAQRADRRHAPRPGAGQRRHRPVQPRARTTTAGACCCCRKTPTPAPQRLKERLDAHFGVDIGIIISDSVGRAWRLGTVGLAIGAAGVPSLWDRRGETDLSGGRWR